MKLLTNIISNPYTEKHPYSSFIPDGAKKLIIGTFPPIKLTRSIEDDDRYPLLQVFNDYLRRNPKTDRDIDFYYGSDKNLFWKILGEIHNRTLHDPETIKSLLRQIDTGITDMCESVLRKIYHKKDRQYLLPDEGLKDIDPRSYNVSSGDSSLYPLQYRDIPSLLRDNESIEEMVFMSSFAQNSFRMTIDDKSYFSVKGDTLVLDRRRKIRMILLPSPSGAANLSISGAPEYKNRREIYPDYTTFQYRKDKYSKVFTG